MVRYDARAHKGSLDVMHSGLVPRAKDGDRELVASCHLVSLKPAPVPGLVPRIGRSEKRDLAMKQLVALAGMLLASSAGAGPLIGDDISLIGHATGPSCQTTARHEPVRKLELKINPPQIKVPDNSKQGTPLATITVLSNGVPFTGKVRLRLTKNERQICRLVGMQLQLARDTTKVDDYTTSVCRVTAVE